VVGDSTGAEHYIAVALTSNTVSASSGRCHGVEVELQKQLLDVNRAREAFAESRFVQTLWPQAMVAAAQPYFEAQRIYNRVAVEGFRPLAQIEDLHFLLTETSLEWLPLWVLGLGNHPIQEHLDDVVDDGTGQEEYARGLLALSRRDFRGAARYFGLAELDGRADLRPIVVYALCIAGENQLASVLAKGSAPETPERRHFWTWMHQEFGIERSVN
jgi:hypothetical protein